MSSNHYESIENFVFKCREDGMSNFIAFAGDGDSKRACIGEGSEDDVTLAVSSVFVDRPEIMSLFSTAIQVAMQVLNENKSIN